MAVTIIDVAERAGVSIKTVSRVINEEAGVRPGTRDRVMRAVNELQYKPNLAARALAANRSFLIGVVFPADVSSYYNHLVVSLASECRRNGLHLVSETFEKADDERDVLRRLLDRLRPEGIVLAPPCSNSPRMLELLATEAVPVVRLGGAGPGPGQSVIVPEIAAAQRLVEHLISQGHRRIAMVAQPAGFVAAQQRVEGYRRALENAGIEIEEDLIVQGGGSFASGVLVGRALLDTARRPTAVFAANDGMALGVMAAARERKFDIPRDIAIAGFDDSPSSRMVYPALTTVRQPIATMAEVIIGLLRNIDVGNGHFEHELLVRGSTTNLDTIVLSGVDA